MSKYEIGQEIPVSCILKITAIQHTKSGNINYSTNRDFVIQEKILEEIEMKSYVSTKEKSDPTATPTVAREDKPRQEVVKLYCVKELSNMFTTWFSVGKIYEAVGGWLRSNNNLKAYQYPNSIVEDGKWDITSKYLIPLVSRPAKVGEWVLITNILCSSNFHNDETYKVICVTASGNAMIETNTHATVLLPCEYLVLDNYRPEPEKVEPTYYSGKVVCVDNGGARYFEVGKVYQFVGGRIFGAHGFYSSQYETLEKANSRYGVGAKFIEYKGEQS